VLIIGKEHLLLAALIGKIIYAVTKFVILSIRVGLVFRVVRGCHVQKYTVGFFAQLWNKRLCEWLSSASSSRPFLLYFLFVRFPYNESCCFDPLRCKKIKNKTITKYMETFIDKLILYNKRQIQKNITAIATCATRFYKIKKELKTEIFSWIHWHWSPQLLVILDKFLFVY
jgi:hypothetical protein